MVSMILKSSSTVRLSVLCSGCFGNVVPSGASLCNQHHTKPCFAFHHPSVSIRSLFERNCFNHRANILEDTEGKSVLAIYRRARQASINRAPSKYERERIQLNLVLRYTHHDKLA